MIKAEEFASKLNALGFVPIIDGVYTAPPYRWSVDGTT